MRPVHRSLSVPPRTQGFTLIELLVVIAIIGILAAILIPSYAGAQRKPYDVAALQCAKAIMTAEVTYRAEHQGNAAGNLSQLGNSDVTEQCTNVQVNHFDSTGLSRGASGDGRVDADRQYLYFLVWSQSGQNLYEVNQSNKPAFHPIQW